MSHFSTMKARFSQIQQIIDTLKFMGVPLGEIFVDQALGVFQGTKQMQGARKTNSSRFCSTHSEKPCQIIVSEAGMRAMAKAAEATQHAGYSLNGSPDTNFGIFVDQSAELGFYDCECQENPGYLMATDPYVSGREFPGYFTAVYQLVGLGNSENLEVSKIARDEQGNFRLQVRQKPKQQRGRNAGASRSRMAVFGRR